MKISAAKALTVIAITGVGVLGAQYADAAPSHLGTSTSAAGAVSAPTSGGAMHPMGIQPKRNIARLYTVSTSGGNGRVYFTIPQQHAGVYAASFSANFYPQGTPAAPKTFSCFLTKDGTMRAQGTVSGTYDSGFYLGVNGANTVKVSPGDELQVGCGLVESEDWEWGTRKLQVTLTKLDGLVVHGLSETVAKAPRADVSAR